MLKYIVFIVLGSVILLAAPTLAADERQRAQMLDYCMRVAERSNHDPSGNVVIGMDISSTGMVTHAAVQTSTTNVQELTDCSLRMIKRWRFPAQPEGWNTTYTVVYSPKGQQARLR